MATKFHRILLNIHDMNRYLLIILALSCMTGCNEAMSEKNIPTEYHPAIALHGGAGNLEKLNLTEEQKKDYLHIMDSAITKGYEVLRQGGSSIDAVETVIVILEDCPLFNAGKGAVFSHEGHNELDASIMYGADLSCGAIAGVRHVKNPIRGARKVMENSEFVLLHGEGAEDFLFGQGIEKVDTSYFFTEHRWQQLLKAREKESQAHLDHDGAPAENDPDKKHGTVGCVAIDKFGHLAAGTSTGGLTNKRYGRIGDSPLIGSGTYADDSTCAVSCTGKGEDFIRINVAAEISSRIRFGKEPIAEAVKKTLHERLVAVDGRGGCIAISPRGEIIMDYTTKGMFRACIDKEGKKTLAIY